MRVLRVEDSEGNGPYVGSCLDVFDLHVGHASHGWPCPGNDTGELREACEASSFGIPRGMNCGFYGYHQLNEWFSEPAKRILIEAGYKLAVYDVPREDVKIGGAQVMFRRGDRKPVEVLPL